MIRVLVVDDFEDWRHFVVSTLRNVPAIQVICEVSDGLEAVQKSEELRPDLILLDIGLPGLNGMDAARQMRRLSPESKILFLSQESSADVVQEALRIGSGFVVKADAGTALLAAVKAVVRGEQFLSNTVAGAQLEGSPGRRIPAGWQFAYGGSED